MINMQETTVKGKTIKVLPFAMRQSLALKFDLVAKLGPALAKLGDVVDLSSVKEGGVGSVMEDDLELGNLSGAIETLATNIGTGDDFVALCMRVLEKTFIGDLPLDNAENFDKCLEHNGMAMLYPALAFTIKVNYGSLFGLGTTGSQ